MTSGEPGHLPVQEPAEPPRRWLNQLPYVLVLVGVGAGLVVVATNHFKRGSVLIAAVVLLGALARLVLPESRVGMLATRRRVIDVITLATLAVAIAVVAIVVPPPRG